MTIREIEGLSGLTRANIRFYESEGLLQPRRLPNGYRDYSDDNLETLKKIKLLRQLHIPLDEIRALQAGEHSLGDALLRCVNELERQRGDLQQAAQLCRAMRSDGVTYQSLDADRYLGGAAALPAARPDSSATRFDVPRACPHPWRRWLARSFDFALCGLLWQVAAVLVFRINPALRSPLGQLLDALAAMLLMLFIEPLFLHFAGFTPGKLIFGLRLTCRGRKLSYFDALCRTGSVLALGEGLYIPVYSLIRNYKCYKKCRAGELLPWEEEYEYELTDTAWWRVPAFAAACLCSLGLCVLVIRAGDLPRHRGALTAAEFAENVNDYAGYLGTQLVLSLGEDGRWHERFDDGVIYSGALETYPPFTLTEENGELTRVSFCVELHDAPIITPAYEQIMLLSALSYVCAQPEVHILSPVPRELARRLSDDPFESFRFEMAGVEIACDVEAEGYLPHIVPGQGFLWADEQQKSQYFRMSFTLCKLP